MGLKKKFTIRRYKKIFMEIEMLVNTDQVSSIRKACNIVAPMFDMTSSTVHIIYYKYRKMKRLSNGEL